MKFLKRKALWFLAAAGARYLFRYGTARSVDRQRDNLVERLPQPLVDRAERLPADPIRVVSSVVVAGKAARAAATGSTKAGRRASDRFGQAVQLRNRLSNARSGMRHEMRTDIDGSFRNLKSRYLAVTEGSDAATNALLDHRPDKRLAQDDLPDIPAASPKGRMRRLRDQPVPKVARAQRSYTPPTKPWDRGK